MAHIGASNEQNIVRRSGNYNEQGEPYTRRIDSLKEEIKIMLEKVENPLAQLKQIDTLQRLGLSYHFGNEIKRILSVISCNSPCFNDPWNKNLYGTSLEFRLLRQHGFSVSSEVFNNFKDERGNFKASLCEDIMGMLSLYEASFHLMKGESVLEEARDFTTNCLEEYIRHNKDQNDYLTLLVGHELELPLHWRMLRLEARWFIDVYEKQQGFNLTLLELAKRDFNAVQSTYQQDLKHASRWWRGTSLGKNLKFARDRLVETFLWAVGAIYEPEFGYCRRMLTRVGVLITLIDDIYDVHGTLDELHLFEDVLERWEINDLDQLPDYMQICFLATYNTVNDMVYDVLKEQGYLIIKYLKKLWIDVCKSYMVEAKWYASGHTPSLQEYIENGVISSTMPLILGHLYCFITNPISIEALECLVEYPNIIRQSSIICRLVDDLGTSSVELKRGDNPKSIQCYMHENCVSEDEARRQIKILIDEIWKEMNEDRFANSLFSETFVESTKNVGRMAMSMYQNGDGFGVYQERDTKEKILSLIVNPIPIEDGY